MVAQVMKHTIFYPNPIKIFRDTYNLCEHFLNDSNQACILCLPKTIMGIVVA